MLLKGRIEVILEQILHEPSLAQSPFDINELKDEIKDLEEQLKCYNLNAKFEQANSFLSQRMTEISKQLNFEKELQPGKMFFDLKTFDFHYSFKNQNIGLSQMGSGANWLACHLSLFISLLHLNCKEKKSSIPSFLFLDQPSQVYFPKTTTVISSNDDENILQVKKIFNVLIKEINKIKTDCGFSPQIIVLEHADEKEFNKYVKERWLNDGKKLI